jgi:hypothetical protein
VGVECHVPVRVRVLGVPDEEALEQLSRQVAARVSAQLRRAARALATAPDAALGRDAREPYDPSRDLGDGYAVAAYDGHGRPNAVPVRSKRGWKVLRAVNFRAKVGSFFDLIEAVRGEELPARVLYDDQPLQERWVSLWWVQVERTMPLTELETSLNVRASELAKVGPRQILADMVSPFDSAWERLDAMDDSAQVSGSIPRPGPHNARRVEGMGQDAVVSHGAWVLFASMVLPGIAVEDVLEITGLVTVPTSMPEAGFLVEHELFRHRWGMEWERFAEEFHTEGVPVLAIGARVKRRTLAQAVYYLATVALDERRAPAVAPAVLPAERDAVLHSEAIFVLTPETIAKLPPALARHAATIAVAPAPSGAVAAPGAWLEPGWPVLFTQLEVPLGADRIAAAMMGPRARQIAAALRVLLTQDRGERLWVFKAWALLDDANAGGPPATRPAGGTLVEHVLGELERTGELVALVDAIDATAYFGLRARLLEISLPTRFGDHPRIARLHADLAHAREVTMRNVYLPGDAGGTVLIRRDPTWRWSAGGVLGDTSSLYIVERKMKTVKEAKAAAFKAALLKNRIAVTADIAGGKLARDLDDEAFAREVLARTLSEVPIDKDDVEDVTVQRSIQLLGVTRRDLGGLPSYDLRMAFVERIGKAAWTTVGQEFTEVSGEFEARLTYWELGRAGEFYQTFGLVVAVVGLVAIAWEAGLIAILVEAAGGATAVAISIGVAELIYLIRVATGHAELSLRGFLVAALEGYLMALGFRFGALGGKFVAATIGKATLRRLIAGWVAERLVAGVVGGAVSAGLEKFAHDVVAIATGEGGWSGIGDYVKAMAFGAAVGVVAEFTLTPALHAMLSGGRTALESAAGLAKLVKAEGWSAIRFSAGITEALANLRASLTTLAGDAAAKGFATALAERLGAVLNELSSSAIARRVLELSGARFDHAATEGLQRFLRAADASANPARAFELAGVFSAHPTETVHFLQALSTMEADAAQHLVSGTFGSPQELAAFLGRIGRYEPAQQRAVVTLLGQLGIVAADPVATRTSQEVMQQQFARSLRVQAAGAATEAANLRAQAAALRAEGEAARRTGKAGRAATKDTQAEALEARAAATESLGAQTRAQADQVAAGGPGPKPGDVVPVDAEVDAALDALENGVSRDGGPQAWVRLPIRAATPGSPVLERVVRPLFRSRSGHRVVFRVEGGSGAAQSRSFVRIDPASGAVRLATGGRALNLNFGVFERAVEFLLQNRAGARLKVFEVEEGWFQSLRGVSTPEQGKAAALLTPGPGGTQVPLHAPGQAPGISDVTGLPRIVDTRYGIDQLQVPAELVGELQEFVVKNSGRVLEFVP